MAVISQSEALSMDRRASATISTDVDGLIIDWRHAAESLYGWSADEVLGRRITDVLVPDDARVEASQIMATLAAGESWTGQLVARPKTGRPILVDVVITPIRDPRGHVIAIVGISRPVDPIPRTSSSGARSGDLAVSLLGTFEVTRDGVPLAVSDTGQRLIAYLGVSDRKVTRSVMAGTLWPHASERRAQASLRSGLSRLDDPTRQLLLIDSFGIGLAPDVRVDAREHQQLAKRLLLDGDASPHDLEPRSLAALSRDLLPDWDDDWLSVPARQWHQLRVYGLEALANKLARVNRFGDAAEAALLAIAAEPLRESAHVALIKVQLEQGNQAEALATSERYRALLKMELALEPTARMASLVAGLQPR